MQVLREQTGGATATIEIQITKSDYAPEVDKALKDYQRKASVPGFRPGKVPFGMVKKMYGNSVIADVINKMVSKELNNHITDNNLKILGYPLSDVERTGTLDFDSENDLVFYFDIAMAPEFDIKLSEIELMYPKVKANTIEIEEAKERLLKDYPEVVFPDTVAENDAVELRLMEADQNHNEVEGGFATTIKVTSNELTDAEGNNPLFGKESGAEFIVNFQSLLGDDEKVIRLLKLKGEENHLVASNFNVIIDEIERKQQAELNEDFFKKVFPNEEIDAIEDFNARIAAEIEKQLEQQSDYYVYSLALKKLIDETPLELSQDFMKRWIVDNADGKLSAQEVEEHYSDYEKSLRFQLIEDKLISIYPELKVEREEVRRFVMSYFFGQFPAGMEFGEEMEQRLSGTVDSILKNKEEEQRIVRQLLEKKMVKLFRNNLSLTEKEMSTEEFKTLAAENQPENISDNQ